MATHRTCDIAILTALGTELDAVLKMLPELKPTKPIEGWFFHEGSIRAQGQGTVYEVVAATSEVSGQGPARALAEITLKEWSPRYLILVGIAAGCGTPYGKEYRRGDILVSTHILDYMRQAVELPKLQETGL